MNCDYLIIGTGFSGSVVAEQLANAGYKVLIIDKRSHLGGNAYDKYDEHGILIHEYGPHIFHTNAKRIFEYLSKFTEWRHYEHRVLSKVDNKLYPIPINQDTINNLYNLDLDEKGVEDFFKENREIRDPIKTSEDVVLNSVGKDLYEKFFKNYTIKQWGLQPNQLAASVAARIPVRTNTDDRYFTDEFQTMPLNGYTRLFKNMLNHPNIEIKLDTDFFEIKNNISSKAIIYTGKIDQYFNYCFGQLPYRSLKFKHEHIPNCKQLQSVGTVNYPNEEKFTRITEFKHLTGQQHSGSSTVKEYPQSVGEPYYPIPRPENHELYKKYEELAEKEKNTYFVGRLAQYRYYNMDQAVGAALSVAQKIIQDNEN